jgi:hypothetical protein
MNAGANPRGFKDMAEIGAQAVREIDERRGQPPLCQFLAETEAGNRLVMTAGERGVRSAPGQKFAQCQSAVAEGAGDVEKVPDLGTTTT